MPGFSTQKLFKLLDKKQYCFLDISQLDFFMEQVASANPDMKGLNPTPRRMAALFRRISAKADSKLSYQDFAKFLQPTDLKPYLERIKKKTKLERKHFEKAKLSTLASIIKTKEKDERKPLTAFKSEVMLRKDNSKEVFVSQIDAQTASNMNIFSEEHPISQLIDDKLQASPYVLDQKQFAKSRESYVQPNPVT